jgi:chromosome segregation ATPase
MIAVFALGAALSAAAFALYLPVVESGFKAKESTLIRTLTQKQVELEESKQQLARVQDEQDIQREISEKLTRAIEEKSRQVDDKDNTISEMSKKLDDERENTKKQRGITQNQLDKTRDELTAVKKKLKDTEQELASAKQELRKVKASLEANRLAKDRPKPPREPEPKSTSGADTVPTEPAPGSEEPSGP